MIAKDTSVLVEDHLNALGVRQLVDQITQVVKVAKQNTPHILIDGVGCDVPGPRYHTMSIVFDDQHRVIQLRYGTIRADVQADIQAYDELTLAPIDVVLKKQPVTTNQQKHTVRTFVFHQGEQGLRAVVGSKRLDDLIQNVEKSWETFCCCSYLGMERWLPKLGEQAPVLSTSLDDDAALLQPTGLRIKPTVRYFNTELKTTLAFPIALPGEDDYIQQQRAELYAKRYPNRPRQG